MHNSLRRPARALAVPTIALLTLVTWAGSADAKDYPDSSSDTTASSTASPTPSSAPRSAAPASGTATPSGSSSAAPSAGGENPTSGDVVKAENGTISACNSACVANLDELLNHMLDVLHPDGSPASTTGTDDGGTTGPQTSPPPKTAEVGDRVTVTTDDGTELTGKVTVVAGTQVTVELTPAGDDTTDAEAALTTAERKVLELVNADRTKVGCPALVDDPALDKLAAAHSADMAARGVLEHTNAQGEDPYARARAAGILTLRAENTAAGQTTAAKVVEDWLGSTGHKQNIENCQFTTSGIGSAKAADGSIYWTQDFGVAVPATSSAPSGSGAPSGSASPSGSGSPSGSAAPSTSVAPSTSAAPSGSPAPTTSPRS